MFRGRIKVRQDHALTQGVVISLAQRGPCFLYVAQEPSHRNDMGHLSVFSSARDYMRLSHRQSGKRGRVESEVVMVKKLNLWLELLSLNPSQSSC